MVQIVDLAFPVCLHPDHKGEIHGGLSKRQWYAGLAMQGLIAKGSYEFRGKDQDGVEIIGLDVCDLRERAFGMADEMLEADNES